MQNAMTLSLPAPGAEIVHPAVNSPGTLTVQFIRKIAASEFREPRDYGIMTPPAQKKPINREKSHDIDRPGDRGPCERK